MGDIIKFKTDSDYYLDLADKRREGGDVFGSISAISYAIKFADSENELASSMLLLAETYYDIGKVHKSSEIYFKLLAMRAYEEDVYFGLAQNFTTQNKRKTAQFYFELIKEGDDSIDEADITSLFDVEGREKYPGYRAILKEGDEYLLRANELIEEGRFSLAMKELQMVKEGDKSYIEAKNELAFCYLLEQKYELSLVETEVVLTLESENTFALCNKLFANKMLKNTEANEKILEIIDSKVQFTPEEKIKLATTMCELCEHKRAVKYFLMATDDKPFFEILWQLLGICYLNLKELDKASEVFAKLLAMDKDNHIARYYMRLTNERKEEAKLGQEVFATLSYVPELPYLEYASRLTFLQLLIDSDELSGLDDKENILTEYVDWLFTTTEVELQKKFLIALGNSETLSKRSILKDIAIKDNSIIVVKAKAIELLLLAFVDEIQYVFEGKFIDMPVEYPESFFIMSEVLRVAFAKALSVLAFVAPQDMKGLGALTDDVYIQYKKQGLKLRSADALAVILLCLNKDILFNEKDICDILDVNYKKVQEYRKKIFPKN